jgi:hypothetical protein
VVLVRRENLASAHCDDQTRFVGQINPEHNVGSIAGMSGGPIICFREDDFEPYFVAAIQSSWLPDSRITFGCPIKVMLDIAHEFLAEN